LAAGKCFGNSQTFACRVNGNGGGLAFATQHIAGSGRTKKVLTRLSGKSRKRNKPPNAGILLSGLFVLLQILDYLDSMGSDLKQITKLCSPYSKNVCQTL
jgi:hypothetical protein